VDTYEPGNKAKVLELTTTSSTGNPYAEIINSCLKLEGLWRPISHWMGDVAPVYNNARWQEDMQVANRWLNEAGRAIPLKIPPPGRVVCTLDERPENPDTCHQGVADSQAIVL